MVSEKFRDSDQDRLRRKAISRWENEGGAALEGSRGVLSPDDEPPETPELTNAELVQLRIRMIALEGLVTALLVDATDQQLDRVREMAAFISPRPGFTQHALTIRAATQMVHLVERASDFRVSAATAGV